MRAARTFGIVLSSALCSAAAGPATRPSAFLAQVRDHFAAWDADHDGQLSGAEIERALADPANHGPAGAAIATLRRSFYAYKYRPITLATVTAAVDHDPAASVDGKPPPYDVLYAADLTKIEHARRDVFAAGVPHVATLGQGRLGDCFLLAGVGTVAAVQPERMKAMVAELPGGRTAVHFGNGQTVTLPAPTDGEVAIGSDCYGSANDGVWGNVFEKAIGQLMLDHQRTPGKYVTPYQIIGVGGTPNVPLSYLTGHKCVRVGCEDFQKAGKLAGPERDRRMVQLRDTLAAAFKAGKLIVGGTADIHDGEAVVPGLVYDHSYGVLGYDRKADVVTFWNPRGNAYTPKGPPGLAFGYPTSHGQFDCPLTDTVMWFGSFSIETDEPAGK